MLLRIEVDKSTIARDHHVFTLPTYVLYDPAERLRFRIIGGRERDVFSAAIEDIRRTASSFLRAAELIDAKQDAEAAFLVGNTYNHLGMTDEARVAYEQARITAEKNNDKTSAQMAETCPPLLFRARAIPDVRSSCCRISSRTLSIATWRR